MIFYDEPQWHYLNKRWQANNLPHAMLLTGQSHLDKSLFAFNFAKYLFCTNKTKTFCGDCRSCQLIQAESHPDIYHLQPEEKGKAIRIDQIRELIVQLNQTAQQNSYKIAIISPADSLNQAAANALLKTLEEPSANTIIFLISEQISLLPATIRSRCQIIKFFPRQDFSPLSEEENASLQELFIDLQQQSPIKVAAKWSKSNIDDVIQYLIMGVMALIKQSHKKTLFMYLDKLYEAKRQTLSSNLNQQLLLENLFCHWQKFIC